MDIKNQRAVYEWANISDDQVYGTAFSKARYMNGMGLEILAHTCTTITRKLPIPELQPRGPANVTMNGIMCTLVILH